MKSHTFTTKNHNNTINNNTTIADRNVLGKSRATGLPRFLLDASWLLAERGQSAGRARAECGQSASRVRAGCGQGAGRVQAGSRMQHRSPELHCSDIRIKPNVPRAVAHHSGPRTSVISIATAASSTITSLRNMRRACA